MCKAMEDYIVKERAEAVMDTQYQMIKDLVQHTSLTAEQIIEAMNISPETKVYLLEKFKNASLS